MSRKSDPRALPPRFERSLPQIKCEQPHCNGEIEINQELWIGIEGTLDNPTFYVYGLNTEDVKVTCTEGHFNRVPVEFLRAASEFMDDVENHLDTIRGLVPAPE